MRDLKVGRIEQLTTHTEAPWTAEYLYDGGATVAMIRSRQKTICVNATPWILNQAGDVKSDEQLERESQANAHLIAAAPELLAACKAVLAQFDAGTLQRNIDSDGCEDWAIKAIEPLNALSLMAGAIAKAEGRS